MVYEREETAVARNRDDKPSGATAGGTERPDTVAFPDDAEELSVAEMRQLLKGQGVLGVSTLGRGGLLRLYHKGGLPQDSTARPR